MVAGLRLLRMVGRGGEGEVWEARDARGRRRALKLIRPESLAADAEQRITALLRIDHPSLIRVLRGGRLDEGPLRGWGYLVMDFVDGPSLQDAAPDLAVLERLEPLAEALDLLHAGVWSDGRPLIHRDVKPANVVARSDGSLVLVDPSTLRSLGADTVTRIGTPVFSAPEVLSGRVGPAADVYSFAVTVVALLTGARGEDLVEMVEQIHALDVPDGVRSALALNPADRPASCRAVLEAGLATDPTVLLAAPDTPVDDWEGLDQRAADDEPDVVPASPWPWLGLLLVIVGAPSAAAMTEWLDGSARNLTLAGAAAVHVVACVAAGCSITLSVLCPPLAWAFLLADRIDAVPLRRDWVRAVLAGVLLAGTAVALTLAEWATLPLPVPAQTAAAVCLVALLVATAAPQISGFLGFLLRVLLLPAWAAGAAVIGLGGLLVAPLAGTARLAGRTLGSFVEVLRSPR